MEASEPADDAERTGGCGGALLKRVAVLYAVLLVASWIFGAPRGGDAPLPASRSSIEVPEFDGEGAETGREDPVRLAFIERGAPDGTPIVLLHGSPGSARDFRDIAPILESRHRLVAPDLPGFGPSTRRVADYSIRAHAAYVERLLDDRGIASAHFVGFSMGGGVALELYASSPERIRSLTLLAAIGVEELELLGDHDLNHGIHGLQLAMLRAVKWLVPHFGSFDDSMLNIEYARNFYDTDQSRLRPILESFEPPMLVIHGERDFLVPFAAAQEHVRIVPQSELVAFDENGHFIPWTRPDAVAASIDDFVGRVERDEARTRPTAEPERRTAAEAPFDPRTVPPFEGPAFLAVLFLLALATLVSEDLACIAAGLLVADGRLGLVPASAACFAGIFVGDMMLYFVGRTIGRPALRVPPLKWVVKESAVDRASHWFERRGIAVIFLSRLTPGLRLPTYVAAGILRTDFRKFAFFFAIAGILWTPALVGIAAVAGEHLAEQIGGFGARQLPWLIAFVLALLVLFRVLPLSMTHKGRRILRGKWMRLTRFEFWPPYITYLPVIPWIAWLSIRHGGFRKVTAANPAMPAGGFVGESKAAILEGLDPHAPEIAGYVLLRAADSPAVRARHALEFVDEYGADFPVVFKPDSGQRGSGVRLAPDRETLERWASDVDHDAIVQERVDGAEYGVFYTRHPDARTGSLFSVTTKILPSVTGDGVHTVEELLLDDPRACAMHGTYVDELGERADEVPADGEVVQLVDVGTHARGAVFLDGAELMTPELLEAIERISRRYEGFYFGRYDLRAPSPQHMARGEGLRIIELNGVTSESTNVYDPSHSILSAYRVLFRQWALAFEIGAANAARGAKTTSIPGILREWWAYRNRQRTHGR